MYIFIGMYIFIMPLKQPRLLLQLVPLPEGQAVELGDGHAKDLVELLLGEVPLRREELLGQGHHPRLMAVQGCSWRGSGTETPPKGCNRGLQPAALLAQEMLLACP